MKYLTLFLVTTLALSSCNVEDEPQCPINSQVQNISHPIVSTNEILNTVVSGNRRYAWSLSQSIMSTGGKLTVDCLVHLNTSAIQIPVTVQIFVFINGEIIDEILVGQADMAGFTEHEYREEFDLTEYFDGCDGAASVRLQLSFQTTGQQSFDDEYLNDLFQGVFSGMNLWYYEAQ